MTHISHDGHTIDWHRQGSGIPALEPGAIHVWRISIGPSAGPSIVAACRQILRPDELERAARFRTERLRDQFVLARGGLRTVLGRYTGVPAEHIVLDRERHGKPVMRAGLAGTRGVVPEFNLSHSGDLALVALTSIIPVGIDVERVRALWDADRIAARFFSPAEYEQYRALPVDDRLPGFFRCWTRKEAFIKAIGEGLSHPLKTFDVSLDPGAARVMRVEANCGDQSLWSMHAFEPAPGYLAAVACRAPGTTLSFFDVG